MSRCSPPGSSVRGLNQARILGWVAISFSTSGCFFLCTCPVPWLSPGYDASLIMSFVMISFALHITWGGREVTVYINSGERSWQAVSQRTKSTSLCGYCLWDHTRHRVCYSGLNFKGQKAASTKWSKSNRDRQILYDIMYMRNLGFPVIKNLPANAGDTRDAGLIPGLGRSPTVGNGSTLQYSCLEDSLESLMGYRPWGHKDSDTTEHTHISGI